MYDSRAGVGGVCWRCYLRRGLRFGLLGFDRVDAVEVTPVNTGWNACVLEPNAALRWIECHPASMAATQDFLLVLTIAAAIAIPAYTEYVRRKQKRADSQAYAASLFAPATQASFDIPRVRRSIVNFQNQSPLSPEMPGAIQAMKIRLPPELAGAMPELHRFDNDVVRPIRSAIMAIQSFNTVIGQALDAAVDSPEHFEVAREKITGLIEETLDHVEAQLRRTVGLPSRSDARDLNEVYCDPALDVQDKTNRFDIRN